MANNHTTTTTTTTTTSTTTRPPPLKFITGADSNGCTLKDSLISHLNSLHIPVDDLGVGPYYSIADQVARRVSSSTDSTTTTLGLVACGTGFGVGIFANKTPGIYAATCLTVSDAINARSINNANVLAVSGMSTSPSTAADILDAFINTPFKSPCPASGNLPWPSDIDTFLDSSLDEMPRIGRQHTPNCSTTTTDCAICYCVAKDREFIPVEIIPGGMMKIVRESPTSAIIKFKAGSVEPAHHHTFGHDLLVMKGKKTVWNLSKNQKFDLIDGDYLFTPAGDVHRVKYFEDTEFFLKWDGPWDIIMDEDLDSAKAAIAKEES